MVTRVWGKADLFELVFSPSGDLWVAAVPADLEDGQYAVELYCEDEKGSMAYWTGILYLNSGADVKIRIVADKFKLWIEPDIEVELQGDLNLCLVDDYIKLRMTCVDCVSRG